MRNLRVSLLVLPVLLAAAVPSLAGAAVPSLAGAAVPAAAPAPEDSAARSLQAYILVVDSLGDAALRFPRDSIQASLPCASTATRLCADDHRDLLAFLGAQEAFAAAVLGELEDGRLRHEAYSARVLPRLREALARQDTGMSPALVRHPMARREAAAYNLHVQPLLAGSYLAYATASNALLERKYFAAGDQGNFVEGVLNGLVGFTRAEPDPSRAGLETFGVSPWEVHVRAEPVYLMRDPEAGKVGGLLTLGVLRHLFPGVAVAPNGEVEVKDGFGSWWVRRLGLKAGYGLYGEDLHRMAGGALQVGPVSFWGLYALDEGRVDFALGLADFALVRHFLPFFD